MINYGGKVYSPRPYKGRSIYWLRNLLVDISLWNKPFPTIRIDCDSQAAIAKAKSKTYNGKFTYMSEAQ